ncbi:MAG: hypothetical protein HY867_11680 [Chloroflexi bacterium]|nr:hypothetical protein [Chloroflexota bacterium]
MRHYQCVLKITLTMADLAGSDESKPAHLAKTP